MQEARRLDALLRMIMTRPPRAGGLSQTDHCANGAGLLCGSAHGRSDIRRAGLRSGHVRPRSTRQIDTATQGADAVVFEIRAHAHPSLGCKGPVSPRAFLSSTILCFSLAFLMV